MVFSFCTPVLAKGRKAVVLGFEVAAGLDIQIGKTATSTFEKLARKQAGWKMQGGSSFEENMLLFCEDEDTQKCIRSIATNLDVEALVTGRVSRDQKQVKITVYFLIDKTVNFHSVSFPMNRKGDVVKLMTDIWNNQFQQKVSRLEINSSEAGAKVFIDNVFVLDTVVGANVIPSITPGPHQVLVRSRSGSEWKTTVNIRVGETTTVTAEFAKAPVAPDPVPDKPPVEKDPDVIGDPVKPDPGVTPPVKDPEPKTPSEPVNLWKVGFWSTAATAVVLLGAGTYTGLQVLSYEDEKDRIMKRDPASYAGINDVCKNPHADMKSTCDSGQGYAMYTNILMAAGLTVGLVSTYFMYRGYLSHEPDVAGQVSSGDEPLVTVLPFVSPNGGGLSLGISF